MEKTSKLDFADWLQGELDKRDWKQIDLARRIGMHSGHISNVLNHQRMPGIEFCVAVARAFRLSPIVVLKMAGLLEEEMHEDEIIDHLIRIVREWSPTERQRFLEMALLQDEMLSRQKRRSSIISSETSGE